MHKDGGLWRLLSPWSQTRKGSIRLIQSWRQQSPSMGFSVNLVYQALGSYPDSFGLLL